jgi:hypothetical protein
MKFNNYTIILIVIILLILYLLDNIKELEDNILKNPNVMNIFNTKYYKPRRKYFKEIHLRKPKILPVKPIISDKKIENKIPIKSIISQKKNNEHLNINVNINTKKESYIPNIYLQQEKEVLLPSIDKFISGKSAPGSTTMDAVMFNDKEYPVYIDDLQKRFNFKYTNYDQ